MSESIETHESLGSKLKRAGSNKVVAEGRAGDSLGKDGKWRKERLVIDRENDYYRHRIEDPDGTVVHDDEGKLSEHWGHGSAWRPR